MICDTSALVAALWGDQPESERCADLISNAPLAVVSPFVLAELDSVVSAKVSVPDAVAALRHIGVSGFELASLDWADIEAAMDVRSSYGDLALSLTDASLVVLSRRYQTNEILTLDSQRFRAIRGLDGRHFRLFPFDDE